MPTAASTDAAIKTRSPIETETIASCAQIIPFFICCIHPSQVVTVSATQTKKKYPQMLYSL